MSDKTTIPRKDGAPDWERMFCASKDSQIVSAAKLGYIAALERCADWHEEYVAYYKDKSPVHESEHLACAIKFRQWIEKEKFHG